MKTLKLACASLLLAFTLVVVPSPSPAEAAVSPTAPQAAKSDWVCWIFRIVICRP